MGQPAVVNKSCITQATLGINVHLLSTAQTNNLNNERGCHLQF